jgi:YVTN family beta-propeller protein
LVVIAASVAQAQDAQPQVGDRRATSCHARGKGSDISLASGTVTHTITVGAAPFGVAVTPNSQQVYITNGGSSSMSVIDAQTDTVTATIPVGAGPQYVQISPNGAVAYSRTSARAASPRSRWRPERRGRSANTQASAWTATSFSGYETIHNTAAYTCYAATGQLDVKSS